MNYINNYINKIICGNALEVLKKIPSESVNCCICSPPYWGLRDYGVEPVIWDGDKNCKHEWGNKYNQTITKQTCYETGRASGDSFAPGKKLTKATNGKVSQGQFCQLCGAWKGSLGLEPIFELYIKHLCDIFDEVKRVLRKDGTCFVVLGDSYGGSGNRSSHTLETSNLNRLTIGYGATGGNQKATKGYEKSLLGIPERFKIEMIDNRGWTCHNTIIWHKPNCMPSSAKYRFTVDFEYVFFFTKSNRVLFWTNEKTLECVGRKPLGIKGIEGKDWEWRKLEQPSQKLTPKDFKTEWEYRKHIRAGKEYNSKEPYKANAPGCKKLKLKKISLWHGHDYWFEQQFEELKPESQQRYDYGFNDTAKRVLLRKTGSANHELTKTPPRQGRNKRAVWTDDSNYEIIVNDENGENIFKAANIPYAEIAKCFGHWFNDKQNTKGATWKIPTQPFPEAHFAVYPEALIEPMIKAGCPELICKKCGKARVKIYEKGELVTSGPNKMAIKPRGFAQNKMIIQNLPKDPYGDMPRRELKEIGYSDCGCNAGWESGIVLDLFMGAGTSALVALKQRKRFIGIEIKKEYIDMSNKRIAKVQQELILV